MKDITELNFPADVRYAKDHEWARATGNGIRVGVSDFAQDRLGDITFVELPNVGDSFRQGEQFGTLESTKAVGDLFMPVGGEILAVNDALRESPGLVNSDPYGQGWIIDVAPANQAELDALLDREAYVGILED